MGAWLCGKEISCQVQQIESKQVFKLTRSSTKFLNMLKQFGAAMDSGGVSAPATDDEHGDGEEHELETSGSA
jgi:hypothetical protein